VTWLGQLVAALVLAVTSATAAAPAERVPPTAPAASSCPQWYGLALEVGWSPDDWQTLDRVMWCESRCDEHAHNPSGASGLLQVMPMHWHGRNPYDARTNLTIGLEVRQLQGWRAWSCY
jgi:soluble lytic murein transglycosylase-like protein